MGQPLCKSWIRIYRTIYIYYIILYIYSIINKLTHLKHLQPFLEIVIPFTTHHPMFPRSFMATSSKLFRCANASQRSCARCSSCARRGTESESFAPAAPMALARMELAGRRPLLGNPMNYPIIISRYYVGWSYWIIILDNRITLRLFFKVTLLRLSDPFEMVKWPFLWLSDL